MEQFQFGKMKKFGRWMVAVVTQTVWMYCHWTVHSKMVKLINCMICIFYTKNEPPLKRRILAVVESSRLKILISVLILITCFISQRTALGFWVLGFFFINEDSKHMFWTKWSLRNVTSKFRFLYLYQKAIWGCFISYNEESIIFYMIHCSCISFILVHEN